MATIEGGVGKLLAKHTGLGKIQRLGFISNSCPELELQCWSILEKEIILQAEHVGITNTSLYKTCMEKLEKPVDKSWVAQIESRAAMKLERLSNDLGTAHQHLQRNQVRVRVLE